MKTLVTSSNPNSNLNRVRMAYWRARREFGRAGQGRSVYSFSEASMTMAMWKRVLKKTATRERNHGALLNV